MPYPSYNPYLSNPYLNQMQPQIAPPTMPQLQQPVNGAIQVNGRDSAMQYQLPPNSTSPALFDTNGKVFYIVTTDGTGTKQIEAFDFSPHVDEAPSTPPFQGVSREEFDTLVARVDKIMEAQNGIHGQVQPAATDTGTAVQPIG